MIDHSTRDHALLSASSAHRWLECPPSAIAAEAYSSEGTDYTKEGTLAHEVAERIARQTLADGTPPTAWVDPNPETTQEMIDCAIGYADYILEQQTDPDAVILLEQKVDFSPWVPGGFGTGDVIILQGNRLDVIDYKFGKGVAVSAESNPQMMLYGLGALNDFGFALAYGIETIRLHIYQPRLNNISVWELSADDLMGWADKIVRPTAKLAAKGEGDYYAGEHCRFCPHAGRCRALTQACTEFIQTHGLEAAVPIIAPWEVADILAKEPLITLWLKRVKDQALSTMLDGGTVPGFKVVAGRGSRGWADDLEVAKLLYEAGYFKEEITKTELLSVAAMEKAIGKKKVAELLGGQILAHTGAPTVVPLADKRPVYDRLAEAQKDFEE